MPIIKAPEPVTRTLPISLKLEAELSGELDQYITYLVKQRGWDARRTTKQYLINEAVRSILEKDREFQEFRSHQPEVVKQVKAS